MTCIHVEATPHPGPPARIWTLAKFASQQPIGSQIFYPRFRHAGLSLTYPFSGFCPERGVPLVWAAEPLVARAQGGPQDPDFT